VFTCQTGSDLANKDVLERYDGEISLFSNFGLVTPKGLIRLSVYEVIGEARTKKCRWFEPLRLTMAPFLRGACDESRPEFQQSSRLRFQQLSMEHMHGSGLIQERSSVGLSLVCQTQHSPKPQWQAAVSSPTDQLSSWGIATFPNVLPPESQRSQKLASNGASEVSGFLATLSERYSRFWSRYHPHEILPQWTCMLGLGPQ
jgi:hypothetical protein